MVRRMIVPAGFAAALGLFASAAAADGERPSGKTARDESRVEYLDRTLDAPRAVGTPRGDRRAAAYPHRHRRYHAHGQPHVRPHHAVHRPWDGRYGLYPRRHFFVTGVSGYGLPGLVNVATVTYRTHVYYTPTHPSVSYGYPPYAHLYDVTPGPIYNKPCFC